MNGGSPLRLKTNLRKLNCIIVFVLVLGSFAGCVKASVHSKNVIEVKEFSEEQKQIVDLISTDEQKVLIFDFRTEDTYKNVDFWVETYKNGKLVDSRAAGTNVTYDDAKLLKGELAVTINQMPDYKWTLIYAEDKGYKGNNTSELNTNYNMVANAYCSIIQPVEIEDGKEIVLYASVFKQESKFETFDIQNFLDTNNLKEYEYAHIIKCKFSK